MISAVKGLPMESQPWRTGWPSAQICLSLFFFIVSPFLSEHYLGELGVEEVLDALDAALAPHAGMVGAAVLSLRRCESKSFYRDNAGLQRTHRATDRVRRACEGICGKPHIG